jgi:CDP-glycerol glycerophosphotransferase (TagB/SpsB family)
MKLNFLKKKYKNKIKAFKSKYNFIENINKHNFNINLNSQFDIMIAPTWGTNFFENCFKKILDKLQKEKLKIIYRPHTMSLKKNEIDLNFFYSKNIKIDLNENLNFKNLDYLISDYSGIIFEYFLIKKKSPILINNIMKKELNNDVYTGKTIEETFRDIVETKYSLEQFMVQDMNSILKKTNNIFDLEDFCSKNFY